MQIAARQAQEHRRRTGAGTFPLQGIKYLGFGFQACNIHGSVLYCGGTKGFIPEPSRCVNRFFTEYHVFIMSTPAPYRVLFVCLGNICRSPAAEIIFNAVAAEEGLGALVQADSCGTASYHTGSRPDRRMLAALERAGYTYCGHRARTFRRADFSDFDLIVPQDEFNEQDILSGMWQWFAADERERSVPDPYYGGPEGFDAVVALLTRSMRKLVAELKDKLIQA